jgi:hypothetical protein
MDEDLIKKRRRELTQRQAKYVAHRERGLPRDKSAILAGYADVPEIGKTVERSEAVQEELQRAREELVLSSGITKEDVLEGLREAARIAKELADPQAMVRAWSELGKMLGYYAPEVKKHLHGVDPASIEALKALPDAELYKIARGRVIDGESKVLESKKDGA